MKCNACSKCELMCSEKGSEAKATKVCLFIFKTKVILFFQNMHLSEIL